MKSLAVLVLLFFGAVSGFAIEKKQSFDDVVYNGELTDSPVEAGFGLGRVLDIIADPIIKPKYESLRKLGRPSVYVQKIPSKSKEFSIRNRFTFTVNVGGGWWDPLPFKKVAELTVDTYFDLTIADGSPNIIEVVSDKRF